MKVLQTIPVYNRKSKRVTSLKTDDFQIIKNEDEEFFDVQGDFVIIKDRFFRAPHLVKPWTFWIENGKPQVAPTKDIQHTKVLFTVEAPDKNEFDYKNEFRATNPLTGYFQSFKAGFLELMAQIASSEISNFEVTFYTLVPYQTSLHYLLGKRGSNQTRLNFWFYGWINLKYRNDFMNYLKRHTFDYYINGSTRAFKGIISQELSRVINVEYQVHHPNSGFWKRKNINLGIKKIIHLELTAIAWT
ncbi:hypothetical protein IMCC3317_05370 [Kordia antarctica]|uniref:Uncharacterized protein n=1 Tax=Kordia antarctica TaxID=1218801 RepID=A0A7L4ZFH7_9FLAO|nr:hypothetical protein [Kordia antarctica]QHI35191.1 hypothetical protein IMCC3317_05370 [Kordia antarctica]